MSTEFIMRNQKEISNLLHQLPKGFDAKFLRRVLSSALTPTLNAARRNAPDRTGLTIKSLGKIQLKKAKFVSMIIGPRVKGRFRATRKIETNKGAWYAHFAEFGTDGYTVKKTRRFFLGGQFITIKKGTFIPGQKAEPFMRPAYDSTRKIVEDRFFDSFIKKFNKEVNRLAGKGIT